MSKLIKGRGLSRGIVEGEAIVTKQAFSITAAFAFPLISNAKRLKVATGFLEAQIQFENSVKLWHSTFPHHFIPSQTALSLARPPHTVRFPRMVPLSRLSGATPTRAAILRRLRIPSSGSSIRRVIDTTFPTPGTLFRRLSFSYQEGLPRI